MDRTSHRSAPCPHCGESLEIKCYSQAPGGARLGRETLYSLSEKSCECEWNSGDADKAMELLAQRMEAANKIRRPIHEQTMIRLGRTDDSKWHIFRGNPSQVSACGQLDSVDSWSCLYIGKAPLCQTCLYEHDYEEAYARKLREYDQAPLLDKPELPIKRDYPEELVDQDPKRLSGKPVFTGTRVPIAHLEQYLDQEYSVEEFAEQFRLDEKLVRKVKEQCL